MTRSVGFVQILLFHRELPRSSTPFPLSSILALGGDLSSLQRDADKVADYLCMWLYRDYAGVVHGPFPPFLLRQWLARPGSGFHDAMEVTPSRMLRLAA